MLHIPPPLSPCLTKQQMKAKEGLYENSPFYMPIKTQNICTFDAYICTHISLNNFHEHHFFGRKSQASKATKYFDKRNRFESRA